MNTALVVAALVVAGLVPAVIVAVRLGKAIHRNDHRSGTAYDPCPTWCARERAAAERRWDQRYDQPPE